MEGSISKAQFYNPKTGKWLTAKQLLVNANKGKNYQCFGPANFEDGKITARITRETANTIIDLYQNWDSIDINKKNGCLDVPELEAAAVSNSIPQCNDDLKDPSVVTSAIGRRINNLLRLYRNQKGYKGTLTISYSIETDGILTAEEVTSTSDETSATGKRLARLIKLLINSKDKLMFEKPTKKIKKEITFKV